MILCLVWLAAALALGAGGCTSSSPGPSAPRVPVNVWLDAGAGDIEFFHRLEGMFEESQPRFTARLKFVPLHELKPSFLGQAASPRAPDVVLAVNDWLGELAGKRLVQEWLEPADHLDPTTLEAMTFAGRRYGVPWGFEVVALFYNRDLVATPPHTFEEMIALGPALRARGLFPLLFVNKNFYFHAPFFFGLGGDLPDASGAIRLDSAAGARSFEFTRDLQDRHFLIPAKSNHPAMINLFAAGQAAFIITGPWSIPEIERAEVRYGIAPLPDLGPGQPARPFLGVKGFVANRAAPNPEGAAAFLRFVATAEVQRFAARETGLLPCLRDGGETLAENVQAFRAARAHAIPLPPGPSMQHVWAEANWALNETFASSARPVADILREADGRLQARLAASAAAGGGR